MLSGHARGLPQGEHDAEIVLLDVDAKQTGAGPVELLARVRTIQAEIAKLPVLDPRSPDEIIGYNERGHFD
jgi:hypothetical protein